MAVTGPWMGLDDPAPAFGRPVRNEIEVPMEGLAWILGVLCPCRVLCLPGDGSSCGMYVMVSSRSTVGSPCVVISLGHPADVQNFLDSFRITRICLPDYAVVESSAFFGAFACRLSRGPGEVMNHVPSDSLGEVMNHVPSNASGK